MATTRRRRRMSGRRRPKGDWVYRGQAIRADGAVDDLATYDFNVNSVAVGIANSDAWVLYDSKTYLTLGVKQGLAGGGAGPPAYSLPQAARAEGSRPLILRVQGFTRLTPSAWAVGNNIFCGWRIMAVPQDSGTGAVLLDNDYSMWAASGATQAADHANGRRLNLAEKRFFEVFNASESACWTIRWNVKLRVRLNSNECLALYSESYSQGVTTGQQHWFRTFVVDEGTG